MTVLEHQGDTMADVRPFMDTEEPAQAEAAQLHRELLGLGTVERMDALLDALRAAYRRGRAAERQDSARLAAQAAARFAAEAQRLAEEHAEQFHAAHTERAQQQAERAARPWYLQ